MSGAAGNTLYEERYDSPLKDIVEEIDRRLSGSRHEDVLLGANRPECKIEPPEFVRIEPTDSPRRIAVVDGGNGKLEETASFLVMINRTCFSLFRGDTRERPKTRSRIEFFSTMTAEDPKGDTIRYSTELYPYGKEDAGYLPKSSHLFLSRKHDGFHDWERMGSMARKFAEWKMAEHVVNAELESGDILIMDGSLQTGLKGEKKYAKALYRAAKDKGVIVCGLSKTSRLLTKSGESLLARTEEIAKNVGYDRWYVKVADSISHDGMGTVMVAKFHPNSEFVFRFEILREQFKSMSGVEKNDILASIAANSGDISMLGYPYAAVDADRFAQVRLNELEMYRNMMLSEAANIPGWERIYRHRNAVTAHERLNEVTS